MPKYADAHPRVWNCDPFVSKLGPFAYTVWISATLRPTVGYWPVYGTFYDYLRFCIR